MGPAVNALARTTGSEVVPAFKVRLGYTHCKDKFSAAKLEPVASELVAPPAVKECPVQMEAKLLKVNEMAGGALVALEVKVLRVRIEEDLRMSGEGKENRVDAKKWRPLIMSFQELFGLSGEMAVESKLARIEEELYRGVV